MPCERSFAKQLGFALGGAFDVKRATSETGILLKLDIFVIGVTARRIEEQQTKGVARPTIVTEKALETRLLNARLFVNRSDGAGGIVGNFAKARVIGLRAAQDRIDEGWTRGTKIWSGERDA